MQIDEIASEGASPQMLCELGKSLMNSDDTAERSTGIRYILKAYSANDPEATFIVGDLMLRGFLRPQSGNPEDCALDILCRAADGGNIQARMLLNNYCFKRYDESMSKLETRGDGPLVDFDGKRIKINRTGIMTPVDAELDYADGINVLTLSANIMFLCDDGIPNVQRFREAVLAGINEWQGDYKVFGNQALRVITEITMQDRLWDNVVVMPMTSELERSVRSTSEKIGTKKMKERTDSLITEKRSFAAAGLRWSVNSRKIICIMSGDGKFDDYEEIKHVAKHEFGHALGLGDLYESSSDSLAGVDKGTYTELDGFYINDRDYNLVMCDHHGPVSNNDIEMVVLAFRENKSQLYQPGKFKGKISKALGRGN